jgi:hypothetical protein
MEKIANVGRVVSGNPEFFAHLLVMEFRQRLGCLHAQAMQVKVFRILAALEKALGFNGGLRPDRDKRYPYHV